MVDEAADQGFHLGGGELDPLVLDPEVEDLVLGPVGDEEGVGAVGCGEEAAYDGGGQGLRVLGGDFEGGGWRGDLGHQVHGLVPMGDE